MIKINIKCVFQDIYTNLRFSDVWFNNNKGIIIRFNLMKGTGRATTRT